jgi:hypothetical protein
MAKKKLKATLPKRIAGVKVPKVLRKGSLGRFLGSPAGQALIVASLVQAGRSAVKEDSKAGVILNRLADQFDGKHGGKHPHDDGLDISQLSAALVVALKDGARSFVGALNPDSEPETVRSWDMHRPSTPGFTAEEPNFAAGKTEARREPKASKKKRPAYDGPPQTAN